MTEHEKYLRRKIHVKYYTLRLPHNDFIQLKKRAKAHGQSIQKELHDYIIWGIENTGYGESSSTLQERPIRSN